MTAAACKTSYVGSIPARASNLGPARRSEPSRAVDYARDEKPWKALLPQFIEHLYFKRFGKEWPEFVVSVEERARLIHKVREVDPLVCAKCGTPMHVIALIDDATVIRQILEHLGRWAPRLARQNQRAPPAAAKGIAGLKPPVREWTYHPVPDIA